MILVDTSIWIDHLHKGNDALQYVLDTNAAALHPFVYGEIALGNIRDRARVLRDLSKIPRAAAVRHEDVATLVEDRRLFGSGIGWIDAHLLASALARGDLLWTRDRRLEGAAARLGIDAASA